MPKQSADPIIQKRRERKARHRRFRALERTRIREEAEKKARVCLDCPLSLVCETVNGRKRAEEDYYEGKIRFDVYDCFQCKRKYVGFSAGWKPGILEVPKYCKIVELVKKAATDKSAGSSGSFSYGDIMKCHNICPKCRKALAEAGRHRDGNKKVRKWQRRQDKLRRLSK